MDVQPIPSDVPALVDDRLVRENRAASRADETKRALLKNWTAFEAWCVTGGVQALPAQPEAVERYLLYLAEAHPVRNRRGEVVRRGLKPAAVGQALWAINARHRMAGRPAPGESPLVRTAMAGIRRRKKTRVRQQAPLTIEHLAAVTFRDDLKGLRDKALLLVGFAGCLRRSELVAMDVAHLQPTALGLRLFVPQSKTDQEGAGAWVELVRARRHPHLCPVEALQAWLREAGITEGAVFRSLGRGRTPRVGRRLSAASVDAIVKWAAGAAGLDPADYGGHSLRAGQATYLSEQGKSPTLIARHGRWKSLNMVLTYCRGETARELEGVY